MDGGLKRGKICWLQVVKVQVDHQCLFKGLRIFISTVIDHLATFIISGNGISISLLILLNVILEQGHKL